jgi:hypothetical protein
MNAFATKAELIAACRAADLDETSDGRFYESGTFVCPHGCYERPDFTPRKYKDGWSLHVNYYYYRGTLYAPKDGRIEYLADLLGKGHTV